MEDMTAQASTEGSSTDSRMQQGWITDNVDQSEGHGSVVPWALLESNRSTGALGLSAAGRQ